VTRVEVPGGQGVQVGQDGIQTNTFIQTYIAQQVIQLPSRPAAGSAVAGKVPQPPPSFQPREGLLAALRESGVGMPVVRSVTGMRGVGKTQVAAAYARSCIDAGWRLVAWINAGDTAAVLAGLAVVATRLGIGQPGADLEDVAALVRNRLEADGERSLVVFDNLADLDGVRPFLPAAGKAQVVITSTSQGAAGLGRAVPVEAFSEEEALAFLTQRTGRVDPAGAVELARELGYLPLALAQAAAMVASQRLDYRRYLDRVRSLPVQDYLTPAAGQGYPHGVAQAVLLSLDDATSADRTGLCAALMDVVSLLSPAGVPRALLYAAGPAGVLPSAGLEHTAADRQKVEQDVDEALGQLADASLLTFSGDGSAVGDGSTVSTHRLIMRVVRERRAYDGTLAAAGARTCDLLSAVTRSLDQPWQNKAAARDTIQQVIALNDHLSPHLGDDHPAVAEELLGLRRWALWCMNDLGDSGVQAIEVGEPVVAECERVLGATHPDTLISRNNLAVAHRAAGRLGEAIPLYERTLADREQVLGDTHPDTLISRNNLAAAYDSAGRLDEAIPLYERTLTDRERVLGDTHPATLMSRHNLAYAYRMAGRLSEAISLYERTLTDRERVLGDTHPDTLMSRNNLAHAYHVAGRPDEAIPLLEQTLADYERVLGDTHPSTLTSRNNLAYAYRAAARLDEAIPLYERTLTDREQVLGGTHPATLMSRKNLAAAYREAGRLCGEPADEKGD
jgi:tetratricopeptide (TPR) repeat protein